MQMVNGLLQHTAVQAANWAPSRYPPPAQKNTFFVPVVFFRSKCTAQKTCFSTLAFLCTTKLGFPRGTETSGTSIATSCRTASGRTTVPVALWTERAPKKEGTPTSSIGLQRIGGRWICSWAKASNLARTERPCTCGLTLCVSV